MITSKVTIGFEEGVLVGHFTVQRTTKSDDGSKDVEIDEHCSVNLKGRNKDKWSYLLIERLKTDGKFVEGKTVSCYAYLEEPGTYQDADGITRPRNQYQFVAITDGGQAMLDISLEEIALAEKSIGSAMSTSMELSEVKQARRAMFA